MILRSILWFAAAAIPGAVVPAVEDPLEVCATVPSLGDLVRQVGGEHVRVTVFSRGSEDAHFVEPRPSFVRTLHDADLLVLVGLEMETGWLPGLIQNARNPKVVVGAPGYLDASVVVQPMEIPQGPVSRARGDVHAFGNPHYILDPLEGLKVAELIQHRLAQLLPSHEEEFETRLMDFRQRLAERLVGADLVQKNGAVAAFKMALLHEKGRLQGFLKEQGLTVGGWLGEVLRSGPQRAVADHSLWPYFSRRFGFEVVALLEPKPGIPPTTGHLRKVIEKMQADGVHLVFASPYFDPRFARFVSENTGARVLVMAHEVEAVDSIHDYFELIDHNITALARSAPKPER